MVRHAPQLRPWTVDLKLTVDSNPPEDRRDECLLNRLEDEFKEGDFWLTTSSAEIEGEDRLTGEGVKALSLIPGEPAGDPGRLISRNERL